MSEGYGELRLVNVDKMTDEQRRDLAGWLTHLADEVKAEGMNFADKYKASSRSYEIKEKKR